MMTDPKPFRVELVVRAPLDVVWPALTEPDRIREWFGWDYDGLDDEIRYIFVDHAKQLPPDRIALDDGQHLELEFDGPRTILRASQPGPLADAGGDGDDCDGMEEGWRTFFEQLRFLLERVPFGAHPGRRTIYVAGTAPAREILAAATAGSPRELWHVSRYQRMIVDRDGHLVGVVTERPLDADIDAEVAFTATVTTYGLDDAAFAAVHDEWSGRWRAVADGATVTA